MNTTRGILQVGGSTDEEETLGGSIYLAVHDVTGIMIWV